MYIYHATRKNWDHIDKRVPGFVYGYIIVAQNMNQAFQLIGNAQGNAMMCHGFEPLENWRPLGPKCDWVYLGSSSSQVARIIMCDRKEPWEV